MDSLGSSAALIDAGVLSVTDAGDIELSPEYLTSVDQYRQMSTDECKDAIQKQQDIPGAILDGDATDLVFLAHLCALSERIDGLSFETIIRSALVVCALDGDSLPTAGVPEGYVPIRGTQLDVVLRFYQRAIIYIWRTDCPPCDEMRDDLEALEGDLTDGVGQFAVYGPDYARHLQETYDVTGGPALLFMADGAIRSRLYGAQHSEVIRSELRTLRERPGDERS